MTKLLFGVSDTQECRRAIQTIIKFFGQTHVDGGRLILC